MFSYFWIELFLSIIDKILDSIHECCLIKISLQNVPRRAVTEKFKSNLIVSWNSMECINISTKATKLIVNHSMVVKERAKRIQPNATIEMTCKLLFDLFHFNLNYFYLSDFLGIGCTGFQNFNLLIDVRRV